MVSQELSGLKLSNRRSFLFREDVKLKAMSLIKSFALFATWLFISATVLANDPVVIEIEQDGEVVLSIPLDTSKPVDIDSVTGWLRATADQDFSCTSEPGVGCEGVEVSMESPVFGSFSVQPASVASGGNVTLTWASTGAWQCEGSGLAGTDWAQGLKAPSGSQVVTVDLDPGDYEVNIRCFNGPVEDTRGPLEVTVTDAADPDPGVPAFCQGRQPENMNATVNCVPGSNLDCRNYESVYRAPFPGLRQARQIFSNRNEYIAMQFTVPSDISSSAEGAWAWVTPQQVPSFTGLNLQTISRCPGDFNEQLIEDEMGANCYLKQSGLSPTVRWAIQGGGSSSRCLLQPGETYYLNVLYTNSPAGTLPDDLNWQCGTESPGPNTCSNNTAPNF